MLSKTAHVAPIVNAEPPANAAKEANALNAQLLVELDAVNAVAHANVEVLVLAQQATVPNAPRPVPKSVVLAAMIARIRMEAVNAPREASALNVQLPVVLDAASAVDHASVEAIALAPVETVLNAPRPVPKSAAPAAMTVKTRMMAVSVPKEASAPNALMNVEQVAVNAVVLASVEVSVPVPQVIVPNAPRPVPKFAALAAMIARTRTLDVSAQREANAQSVSTHVVLDAASVADHASVEAIALAPVETVLNAPRPVPKSAAHAVKTAKTQIMDAFVPSKEENASIAPNLAALVAVNAVALASVLVIAPAQLVTALCAQISVEREL